MRTIACDGTGSVSAIVAGLDWLGANFRLPAIASMSLGSSQVETTINSAVVGLMQSGVTVVSAAGNFNNGAAYGGVA